MSDGEREVNLIKICYPESWSLNWEPIGDGRVHIKYTEVHAEGTPHSAFDITRDFAKAKGLDVEIAIKDGKFSVEADLTLVQAYGFCLGELIAQALQCIEPAEIGQMVEEVASVFQGGSINVDEFIKLSTGMLGKEGSE